MTWLQTYDPLHNVFFSTLAAILPALLLLTSLAFFKVKTHTAGLIGLSTALLIALMVYRMPPLQAVLSALYGMAYGFLPIGWIILNVLFLYHLTERKGLFRLLQNSLTYFNRDRRLQLLLVAFCFGAFLEGAAGFGTPVAVAASMLIGLGFPPLSASVLALIANTAPVPFAGLGTPVIALQTVTGLDLGALTLAIALQLSLFDLLIPFLLVAVLCGWHRMLEIWPALLTVGFSYAAAQLAVASLHGPWLVNIIAALVSMGALALLLRFWQPKHTWRFPGEAAETETPQAGDGRSSLRGWVPWGILSLFVFAWGLPQVKQWLDGFSTQLLPVPALHEIVVRMPPVTQAPQALLALFEFAPLSASGTAIFLAALAAGLWMGFTPRGLAAEYLANLRRTRQALLTISVMMAVGFVMRYAGMDGTLGLAFAATGVLYPLFGTLLGWLGVMITGSDTSSNVLFGSLQRITAEQLGIDPVTMAAANSSGGVMGKMVNAQSLVVASTATNVYGQEGAILKRVFGYSLALALLVGLVVMVMAG